MRDLMTDPRFLQYAGAIRGARSGTGALAPMLEARKVGLAMQDQQVERERLAAEAERTRRQREALEAMLADEGISPERRAIVLAGLNDPAKGLLAVQTYDRSMSDEADADAASGRVGEAIGSLLPADDPRSEVIRGLLSDPSTAAAGQAMIEATGILDAPTGAKISDAMLKEFTTESVARYQVTGDPSVLERYTPPDVEAGTAEAAAELTAEAAGFESLMDSPLFEVAVGPVDSRLSSEWNPFVSQERQTTRRNAEMAANRLILSAAESLKGALSDRDIRFLEDSQPKATDDESTWYAWYNNDFRPRVNAARSEQGLPPIPAYQPGRAQPSAQVDMPDDIQSLVDKYTTPAASPAAPRATMTDYPRSLDRSGP